MDFNNLNFAQIMLLACGLPGLVGLAAIVWLTRERVRHQNQGASKVIELEVASCALMPNGDVVIRRRRFRSLLVVPVGLGMVLSCSTLTIYSVLEKTGDVFAIVGSPILAALGMVILLVSFRALLAPDIVIDTASRTVMTRPGWFRRAQAWRFDAVAGILTRPPYKMMYKLASIIGVPSLTEIRLRLRGDETVFLCTAPQAKSAEVLHLLSAAIGKPVLQ